MIKLLLFLFSSSYFTFTVGENHEMKLYWRDSKGEIYGSFDRLKDRNIIFATNAGAYNESQKPVGLFINEGKVVVPINNGHDKSNFSARPNGVFYITKNGKGGICKTEGFVSKDILYANQSGPMLVIDGEISTAVINKNNSYFVRNGVGVLKDGTTIFAISRGKVTMLEFAEYFLSIGSVNALYFDGGVSQAYPMKTRPEQHFGVMVGVAEK